MAIFGTETPNSSNNSNGSNKPEELVYLNPGQDVMMKNSEGVMESVFIALPFGLGVMNMSDAKPRGNSAFGATIAAGKNQFLADLRTEAAKLAPGEAIRITGLTLELRRKATKVDASADDDFESVMEQIAKIKLVG